MNTINDLGKGEGEGEIQIWVGERQRELKGMLESPVVTGFMTALTFWALFGDDLRLALANASQDYVFEALLTVVFFCFVLEVLGASFADPTYLALPTWKPQAGESLMQTWQRRLTFGSFYFWLDLASTLSLMLELPFIQGSSESADDSAESARAGRASRAGAKAGKIIKLIRMTRLVRTIKLYKYMQAATDKEKERGMGDDDDDDDDSDDDDDDDNETSYRRSRIGSGSLWRRLLCLCGYTAAVDRGRGRAGSGAGNGADGAEDEESKEAEWGEAMEPNGNHLELSPAWNTASTAVPTPSSLAAPTHKKMRMKGKWKSGSSRSSHAGTSQKKYSAESNSSGGRPKEEEETHVGTAMTELTTRRVIILVLVMLITIPFFIENTQDGSLTYLTRLVSTMHACGTDCEAGLDDVIAMAVNNRNAVSILDDATSIELYLDDDRLHELRSSEVSIVSLGDIIAVYDIQEQSREGAMISCYLTLFVILLLGLATYILSGDMNRLVITPIGKMVLLVKKISADPLGQHYGDLTEDDGFSEGMETTLLMQTINKIGRLMKVGFGEAGTAVIADVLANSRGGQLDFTRQRGRLVRSVFGFCDIRQFTDTTECLQEEVMLFVNRIASILHSIVVQCDGSANKNIGDAFLLTWKLDGMKDEGAPSDQLAADKALYAFVKTLMELKRHNNFICNFSATATQALYKRFPEYRVRIGSGLHVGWAVEGALGSHRKIDASYLSPHVNMSEFLESSTKAYGCALLMSEPFFDLLSEGAQACCRQVDRVASPIDVDSNKRNIKEGMAMCLYTFDMDERQIEEHFHPGSSSGDGNGGGGDGGGGGDMGRKSSILDLLPGGGQGRRASFMAGSGMMDFIAAQHAVKMAAAAAKAGKGTGTGTDTATGTDTGPNMVQNSSEEEDAENGEATSTTLPKAFAIELPRYSNMLWGADVELLAVRRIFKDDAFKQTWHRALESYVRGDWMAATDFATQASALIFSRSGKADGPAEHLLGKMRSLGTDGRAPADWKGYHTP
jgi:class 3 adenylate cyclase